MDTFVWSVHKLPDGRWEILTQDPNPHRSGWRRIAIVGSAGEPPHLTMPRDHGRGSQTDSIRPQARRLRRVA
jgi:hypothetical protein